MTATLAVNLDPPEGSARWIIHAGLATVSTVFLVAFGWPVLKKAIRKRITLELLFLVGLIGAFAASLYSSLTGVGHIYYEVVIVLLAIYRFGQLVSARQVTRLENLAHQIPGMRDRARVVRETGSEATIPVAEVRAGDLVRVFPGEIVPVDGVVLHGDAYLEELPHTGEPFPVPRSAGAEVLAGTQVLDGEITVKAGADGHNRQIDRLGRLLEENLLSRTEILAQKILDVFVPVVVSVALLTFVGWFWLAGDLDAAIFNALAVTVVACPCGLGLAIPLAAKRCLFRFRLLGLVPRVGDFADRLARIDTVVFDKTGTLSEPGLRLLRLETTPSAPDELESWLAAIQRRSTHPVARPFWNLARSTEPDDLSVKILPARGIEADFRIAGREHRLTIGNDLFRAERTGQTPTDGSVPSLSEFRNLYVYLDGAPVARAVLGENPRESSPSCLARLRESGLAIELMTGDSTVSPVFAPSFDEKHTSLKYWEKGELIRRKQADGRRILFVGDGLNDSEGLQAAEASIALSSGQAIASGVAHAVLDHDDLSVIPEAIAIALYLSVVGCVRC